MAMVKKKTGWEKLLVAVIAIMAVIVILELALLGWLGGIGPFRGLREVRMNGMEGNQQEYDFSNLSQMEESPLAGGRICILGSSVTLGSASGEQAVGEYLAARFGAGLYKEAESGTTLTDRNDSSYVSRLKTIPTEERFDLFVCQLSTNDATLSVPLGEISEGTGLDCFDTSTVTGAMEYIIAYAKATWGCPVVFYTGSHYQSAEYTAMVKALQGLGRKWGIGVLDLWTDEEFNSISEELRALYMWDDIHPTKAGYSLWWGPELERQLMEFLNEGEGSTLLPVPAL